MTNNYSNEANTVGNALDTVFLKKNQGSNNASENVVTDANGDITTEAKPDIPTGSSTATDIKMDGSQSAGLSNNFARADHIHPSDTSKVDKVSGKGLSTNDFTDSYKNSLDSINSSYPTALNQIASLTANKLNNRQTDYKGKNVVVHSTSGEITFEDKNNHTHTVSNITDFPSIPSASSSTPSADTTNGSVGSNSNYAKADHTHPKSSLYADAGHSHSFDDLTDKPPIIEEMPFYWVDDFLTYASNSYNIFYDPNNDVQYLVEFIGSNDNDSGFTSNDIKTDRLYQIPYGSSYTHDICVAFTYDEVNEEYNAHYVTTNERYATLYELSLKADANHSHSFNDLTNKPSTTAITINYVGGTSTTLNVYHS